MQFRPTDDTFKPGMNPEAHFRFFERDRWNLPHVRAWQQSAARVDLATSGGHEAVFPGRKVYPQKFLLKHYSLRTPEQGRRKVAERLQRYHPGERQIGWHHHYDDLWEDGKFVWSKEHLLEWGRDSAVG
jgi:hypothetical protein